MTPSRSTMILSCACILVLAAGLARAKDCPEWGGRPDRNMVSDAKGLPATFNVGKSTDGGWKTDMSTTRNVKWVTRLGSQTYGNTVVAGGRIVVGTNDASVRDERFKRTRGGAVVCLDEATGKQLWQLIVPRFRTKDKKFNYDDMNLGICNAATIDGDRVYVLSNRGEMLCLDLKGQTDGNDGPYKDEGQFMAGWDRKPVKLNKTDADIIWRFDTIKELPVWPQDASSSAALIHDGLVYVGTSNGVDRSHSKVPYPDAPTLIALDKDTGQLVAQDDEKIGRRLYHGHWSSPTLAVVGGKPQIIFGDGEGVVYAFEPAKRPPAGKKAQVAVLQKIWWCHSNPKEYRFLPDGKVRKYDKKHRPFKGTVRGQGKSEIIATPVFHKNRIYVAVGEDPRHGRGEGVLVCIDATKTGDISESGIIWSSKLVDRSLSTVSIADGLLYVADYSGQIHCFDAETGKRHWVHQTESPLWSSTFVADGKVYLGTENKELWTLQAGKEKKVLGKTALREKMSNTPLVANGILYVATGRYLYAVQAKKGP